MEESEGIQCFSREGQAGLLVGQVGTSSVLMAGPCCVIVED